MIYSVPVSLFFMVVINFVAAWVSTGLHALCCRAADKTTGSVSLHSTLRRIQKELTQSQAESGWQPPATTGSVNNPPAGEAELALTEQPPADAAAAGVDDDMGSSFDTDASASTMYGQSQHHKHKLHGALLSANVNCKCCRKADHEDHGLISCPKFWGRLCTLHCFACG